MENISCDGTPTDGTCALFGSLYSFHVNVYTRSYLPVLPVNDLINKDGSRPRHLNFNRYETFNITFKCFILSMCCTKSYCTCWDKGVKHTSPSVKGFSQYFSCNSTATKRLSCLCTTQTQYCIFVQCCI